jgi:hypothetical protein
MQGRSYQSGNLRQQDRHINGPLLSCLLTATISTQCLVTGKVCIPSARQPKPLTLWYAASLVGYVAAAGGKIAHAAMLGKQGGVWAITDGFEVSRLSSLLYGV